MDNPKRNLTLEASTRKSGDTSCLNPAHKNKFFHKEVHATKCVAEDCSKKVCPNPCDLIEKKFSLGHLSSKGTESFSQEERDLKRAVEISPLNYKGKEKKQMLIIHNEPENIIDNSKFKVEPKITKFIQKPEISAKILSEIDEK